MEKKDLPSIIGNQIRKKRLEHGMNITELANLMEISQSYLGLIERGERGVTAYNFYKLSEIFDVPVDDLFLDLDIPLQIDDPKNIIKYKMKKAASLINSLNEKELDFLLKMIRAMNLMKKD